ncbi:MAG: DUF2273 domain-containing protein [Acidaminococcaceae bacterium]|nr:DUF2273 domain-containing protein [Acidaminococcaceae bacterium]
MITKIINELWDNYRGRTCGVLVGIFIGALFLILGFFQTIFLLICIGIGFFIGNKVDNKEDLLDLLDRLLPPGYHR